MNYSLYTCSKCGGMISKGTRICPHCHAYLYGIQCKRCYFIGSEREFIGDLCPKCGSRVSYGHSSTTHFSGPSIGELIAKASRNLICLFGKHKWDGCECEHCGKTRHKVNGDDCEKCAECGAKVTHPGHNWKGCKCTVCKTTRDQDHDWRKNCNKCSICGKGRKNAHNWDRCKCTICGSVNITGHDWDLNLMKCQKCSRSVFDVTISLIVKYISETKYDLALHTLKWAENAYGSNFDLKFINIIILLEINNHPEINSNQGFSLPKKYSDHKELKEAVSIFDEINNQASPELLNLKSRLVKDLINSAINHVNENKPFIPYSACGDLVYQAKSDYRRAVNESIALIALALKLDSKNTDVIKIKEQLSKLIDIK